MAFLDNSGDIILDAVLTDAGRQRMARGEFKIVKFALSDEEIDYSLYDPTNSNGSAFYDLKIMQTPILEAFTNNTSLMKTKLLSIARNNILHLPIFRLNNQIGAHKPVSATGGFYLSADKATDTQLLTGLDITGNVENKFQTTDGLVPNNLETGPDKKIESFRIDQGLDTGGNPSVAETMPADLKETAFLVRVDHRLLRLRKGIKTEGYPELPNSFVDDDAIASYYISSTESFVQSPKEYGPSIVATAASSEMFDGPLGPQLNLMLQTSTAVQTSEVLFDELGTTGVTGVTNPPASNEDPADYKFIDTVMNVVGVTTGYSIDIPIRIWKYTA